MSYANIMEDANKKTPPYREAPFAMRIEIWDVRTYCILD
jgi:hypothetical protein